MNCRAYQRHANIFIELMECLSVQDEKRPTYMRGEQTNRVHCMNEHVPSTKIFVSVAIVVKINQQSCAEKKAIFRWILKLIITWKSFFCYKVGSVHFKHSVSTRNWRFRCNKKCAIKSDFFCVFAAKRKCFCCDLLGWWRRVLCACMLCVLIWASQFR